MEHIQSTKNSRVKEWKKLLAKKDRDITGRYIIEGEHLIEEALETNDVIELILQENIKLPDSWLTSDIPPVTTISADISKIISDTKTPQGVFAVCRKKEHTIDLTKHKRFLLFDGVQDPGNIGTMIRTADAAGIDVVILGEGSGDVYNPKVIRSAQGSHFHLPIILGNLHTWIETLKKSGIPVYGTALEGAVSYKEVSPSDSFALIVGNEGAGVASDILNKTDRNLYIPIYGKSESLNVAVAAGILLYYLRK
ncbi:RNA methyltransferase [Bacillus sp. FJAT-49732]|uniref:RNA methyltransferase n=1 Tax=Lederbergia citrisecunda TaxID=2833583 RepID=A0A942YK14_9BACI|nr:RNA methyltransferase [Lederbergia citrisecunda]MBS4199923.1 RNA methyltransferase [Lederbergia citrisecunda]